MSSENEVDTESTTQTKQVGRPRKSDLQPRRKPGRPPGEAAKMREFRNRILNSPKSQKVIKAIFKAALDPNDKDRSAAWKILMDRIAPTSGFAEAAGKAPGGVQISVEVVGDAKVNVGEQPAEPEAIEAEFEEVEDAQSD